MNSNILNPFDRGNVGLFNWPSWVGYTLGSFLIVLGILAFFYYPKTKQKALAYKNEQLKEYNKKYQKNETNYERSGMYLPAWERCKMWTPVFFGLVLIFIGIAWIVGNTLSTL